MQATLFISLLLVLTNKTISSFQIVARRIVIGRRPLLLGSSTCTPSRSKHKNINNHDVVLVQQSTSDVNENLLDEQLKELGPSDYSNSEERSKSHEQDFELWLDLRGTTISPQVALSHLTNDLWDEFQAPQDKSFLVDRVLVDANKMSASEMQSIYNQVNDEYEDEIKVLYQKNNEIFTLEIESSEVRNDNGDDSSFVKIGQEFQMFDKKSGVIYAYSDPLPAVELTSSGKWLVLDSSDMEDEVQRKEATQSLAELCSGGLFPTLDMMGDKNGANEDNILRGGIAIDCTSNTNVLESCSFIKSMLGHSNDYITTDSGILILNGESSLNKSNIPSNGRRGINFCIMLPLDALLWKTMSFVATSSTQKFDDIM